MGSKADLIDTLFQGSFEPSAMVSVLDSMKTRLRSTGVNLRLQSIGDQSLTWSCFHGDAYQDEAGMRAYLDHWRLHDTHLRIAPPPRRGRISILLCHERITDAEIAKDPYMQEFLLPRGHRYMTGFAGEAQGQRAVFGAPREAGQGRYDAADRRFLSGMALHLQRAALLAFQAQGLRGDQRGLAETLAASGIVCLKTDAQARIREGEDAAAAALRRLRCLAVSGGRLRMAHPDQDALLRRALAAAANRTGPGPATITAAEPGGVTVVVEVLPSVGAEAGALVLIRARQRDPATAVSALRAAFRMTRAEAQIAVAIAAGHTPAEVAGLRSCTVDTVRTHLKSIFLKTGAERQAELAALVWRYST